MNNAPAPNIDKIRWIFKRRPLSRYSRYLRRKLGLRGMSSKWALRNLVDIASAFDSRGSQYALTAGTLLGAVRGGDFISHDVDTDLMVPMESFDPRVVRDLFYQGFRITRCCGFPDDGMELTLRRRRVNTDLFFLYTRGTQTYLSGYVWEPFHGGGTADWLDYEFAPFVFGWLNFKGHRFRAPADPESFLVPYYGESWRTPIKTWAYWVDPPNMKPRPDRLNFAESHSAIAEFMLRETGMCLKPRRFSPLPAVRVSRGGITREEPR